MLVGHNHGNYAEELPTQKQEVLRVENCVSTNKKRAGERASYVEIDISKISEKHLKDAVKFIPIKND